MLQLVGLIHATQITAAIIHGLGRHMQYLSTDQREQTIRLGVLSLLSSFLSPMIGRIGFLVTVYYLAGTDKRVKRWPVILFVAGQLLVRRSCGIQRMAPRTELLALTRYSRSTSPQSLCFTASAPVISACSGRASPARQTLQSSLRNAAIVRCSWLAHEDDWLTALAFISRAADRLRLLPRLLQHRYGCVSHIDAGSTDPAHLAFAEDQDRLGFSAVSQCHVRDPEASAVPNHANQSF